MYRRINSSDKRVMSLNEWEKYLCSFMDEKFPDIRYYPYTYICWQRKTREWSSSPRTRIKLSVKKGSHRASIILIEV